MGAMSGNEPTAAGGTERSNSALHTLRQATRETAGGQAGGDSDEPTPDLAPDEHACGKCGRQIGNAGALARHTQACEGDGEPETENSGGSAYKPTDMEAGEIGPVCERMSAADAQATCEALGRKPQDGKRIQHTASVALAKAHPGVEGADGWTHAFGECANPDCEYGAAGLDAAFCRVCTGRTDAGESADDADDAPERESASESDESPDDILFGGR